MSDVGLLVVAEEKIAKILGQAQVDSKTAVLIYQVLVDTLEKPLKKIFDDFPNECFATSCQWAITLKEWKEVSEKRVVGGKQP